MNENIKPTDFQIVPSPEHHRSNDLKIAELLNTLQRKTSQGFSVGDSVIHEGKSIMDYLKNILSDSDTGILTDSDIKALCEGEKPMLSPFVAEQVRVDNNGRKIMSYGLSSMGYDIRLQPKFKIFTNSNSAIVDPKNFDEKCLVDGELKEDDSGVYVLLPPNSYLLGVTEEYFCIPKDVVVVAVGKSTYARSGAIVNVTPIEPGFEGNVVIEVSNSTPLPLKIYANEGISQFLFWRSNKECAVSYADKNRKYQGQTGIVLPRT